MPLLRVVGTLPTASHLRWKMGAALKAAAASVAALEISETMVTVVFSGDEVVAEGQQVIIVVVELLLDKPARNEAVQKELAETLLRAVAACFDPRKALRAEVVLQPLVPEHRLAWMTQQAQ